MSSRDTELLREMREVLVLCTFLNDRISLKCAYIENKKLPCGTKFLLVLTFAIFSAIRKNKFPQIKITAKIFPAKIYSRENIF